MGFWRLPWVTLDDRVAEAAHRLALERIVDLENELDEIVLAYDLPGDHCEMEQCVRRARDLLKSSSRAQT